jgi:tRNA A-37 threonylcarbamoyl transferase component Bud32
VNHPQRLGKYQITEVLGEGAMGVVYKALDPDIRRVVALKTIRRQLIHESESESAQAIELRFLNEAQAGGRLSHPGIVAVYDFGQDGDLRFIAMEFVEGQSLARFAGNGVRFTDEDIPGVMSQLLDALDHAHHQGVWHRDIKPANIIMTRAGRLKVADFGIARLDDGGLTQVNTMVGTPAYMAPEQITGQAIDHRVDIYSAGVLLYLLLTGRAPFVGATESVIYRAVNELAAPPSSLPEGSRRPRFYDALVATALAKDPDQRFASAAAFKQALLQALGRPIDEDGWDKTIIAAALPATAAVLPVAATGNATATRLDKAVLAQAEASLARHVGPLASLLVRRAAQECKDAPELYAKLAEQIASSTARQAFLGPASGTQPRMPVVEPGSKGAGATRSQTLGTNPSGAPMSDGLLAQSAQLLIEKIGPIGKLVAKQALARNSQREAYFAALADAVVDPVKRARLLDELSRLR